MRMSKEETIAHYKRYIIRSNKRLRTCSSGLEEIIYRNQDNAREEITRLKKLIALQ